MYIYMYIYEKRYETDLVMLNDFLCKLFKMFFLQRQ